MKAIPFIIAVLVPIWLAREGKVAHRAFAFFSIVAVVGIILFGSVACLTSAGVPSDQQFLAYRQAGEIEKIAEGENAQSVASTLGWTFFSFIGLFLGSEIARAKYEQLALDRAKKRRFGAF